MKKSFEEASRLSPDRAAATATPHAEATTVVSEARSPADLSKDLLRHIASYLPRQEIGRLSAVSKALDTELKTYRNLPKFLLHVAHGQQDEAAEMLHADPSLLVASGEFTDYSGRRFICSAFEYAYWAKDTHMCRMLAKVDEEGVSHLDKAQKMILRARIDRMEKLVSATGETEAAGAGASAAVAGAGAGAGASAAVAGAAAGAGTSAATVGKARGLAYWQNGVKHQSAHFDFMPLVMSLEVYVTNYDAWYHASDFNEINAAWKGVGLAQREVPAHVAQEYCRPDRSFFPTPGFKERMLPRGLYFSNNTSTRAHFWFPIHCPPSEPWFPLNSPDSGLGFDFAVTRGAVNAAAWKRVAGHPALDFQAMRTLDQVRTAQLKELRFCLNPSALTAGADTAAGGEGASATDGASPGPRTGSSL